MKIILTNIEYQNKYILVEGITDIGIIKGIWRHDESPSIGNEYYIELDIDSIDMSKVSVINSNNATYEVRLEENNCVFTGRCEEIDDIYIIRFSVDWIEMVEIVNDNHIIKKGDWLCFNQKCNRIDIYPYDS